MDTMIPMPLTPRICYPARDDKKNPMVFSMRTISALITLTLLSGCAQEAKYAMDGAGDQDLSKLVGRWKGDLNDQEVQLDIDDQLHMTQTTRTDEGEIRSEYDLTAQDGELVVYQDVSLGGDMVESRHSTQSYFVDFEVFLPIALIKEEDPDDAAGTYRAFDIEAVEVGDEMVVRRETRAEMVLNTDGTWARVTTASTYYEYDGAQQLAPINPPLTVTVESAGTWSSPSDRMLSFTNEGTGETQVVPWREGSLPGTATFWRQP